MSKVEKLEVNNIIEIKLIRKQLQDKPNLLEVFDYVCNCANKKLNDEKYGSPPPLEPEEELTLELDSDTDDEEKSSLEI